MKTKLRPLSEINENEVFYAGTVLREFNMGRYSKSKYYDYMLVSLNWESNMIVVNITENSTKKGFGYGGVIPVDASKGIFAVTKKGFEHTFGKDLSNWYILDKQ